MRGQGGGDNALPVQARFQLGDQVFYWRGNNKRKADWAFVWHGPATVIGFERNNVWVQHRGFALKCAATHVRPALPEEQIPWRELLKKEQSGDSPMVDQLPSVPMGKGADRSDDRYINMGIPDSSSAKRPRTSEPHVGPQPQRLRPEVFGPRGGGTICLGS